ncbi:MAG: acetyl-CoA C-acetyltransferase [Firmicutes bacterium]|nr:acetyl-CoA C-acetyltransferase [Bacillota bacterium]
MKRETVIISAARTPFGVLGGAFKDLSAMDLGGVAIKAAVSRAGIRPEQIDNVFYGQVVQAGAGQIPSRQAAIKGGIPVQVPSETINKVCASSLRAVNLADMMIRAGDAEVVVAGGMESMSSAPYLLEKARFGYRLNDGRLIDAVVHDGLWCPWGDCHMGIYGSQVAAEFGITRQQQDEWAYRSHLLAAKATDDGLFQDEIVPVEVPQKRGAPVVVSQDEAIRRDTSLERLATLKPVFLDDGTVTAGNAPGLNDGASALVLMSREKAEELGVPILATIIGQGQVSEEPKYLHTVPARSGLKALQKAGLGVADLDLIEINEAFAAVTLTSIKVAGFDPEKVNVNGGAVALGHPVGASGGRILMTLMYELRRRGGRYGLAAICSGGGQGEATLIRAE